MKLLPATFLSLTLSFLIDTARAQVNSGSNGSDGAFTPTANITINMADHPDGTYHYTSVNIPSGITVWFIPNSNNTPVVWLVKSNVFIDGRIDISGADASSLAGAVGGPGAFRGGNSGANGLGPGGGNSGQYGGGGSFGSLGSQTSGGGAPGPTYGNKYLIPMIGGSGGGGAGNGGGGGGGAILIAANGQITLGLNGRIVAMGGDGTTYLGNHSGSGSGGAIRFVAQSIVGNGNLVAGGGTLGTPGGAGRVRFDTLDNNFSGQIQGDFSQGFQPIVIQTNGQGAQLKITSIGGAPVSTSTSGQLATPDAVLSAQQNNPIPIVVHCSNIPLNTQITVSVKPANGAAVSAMGLNSSGTLSSSTATVLVNMPRGGGIIYATAAN